jgi:hypothetical protein
LLSRAALPSDIDRDMKVMGRDQAEQPMPDLFSTDRVRDASPPQSKPSAPKATPENAPQSCQRICAVKHLSDGELDLMHAATLEEDQAANRTRGARGGNHLLSKRRCEEEAVTSAFSDV